MSELIRIAERLCSTPAQLARLVGTSEDALRRHLAGQDCLEPQAARLWQQLVAGLPELHGNPLALETFVIPLPPPPRKQRQTR